MLRDSDSAALAASPIPPPVADRRASFAHRLGQQLRPHGIAVVSANLGCKGVESVWVLAVRLKTRQVVTLRAAVPPAIADAFSDEACGHICGRVVGWVSSQT